MIERAIIDGMVILLRLQYWTSVALCSYAIEFVSYSIAHRWLMCSAWFLLGVVVGKAKR